MTVDEIIQELRNLSTPEHLKKFAYFGIPDVKALGVKTPDIRNVAKKLGKNHQLGFELWKTDIHEARMLASMLMDGKLLTNDEFDALVADFDSWDVCDCACGMLYLSSFAEQKVKEYADNQEEFVKRTAFVLMCAFAVHDKKKPNDFFLPFLQLIEREAWDNRNFVRKAVNWALRQIGKRNETLRLKAIETAERIKLQNTSPARWIANDALRELKNEKVVARVKNKK